MDDGAKTGLWAQGWTILDDDGFIGYVGPLWHRMVEGRHEYAIEGQRKPATGAGWCRAAC